MLGRNLMTSHVGVFGGFVLATSVSLLGQSGPPVQGTVALEGTTKKVYAAAHIVVVKTIDGVEHIIHYTKDLLVHGGKGAGVDALQGLDEGSTVVVHYTAASAEETAQEIDRVGDKGLKITEGVVERVDRRRKQMTIRYANGKRETLRLTDRAAAEAEQDINQASGDATKVVVYYSDETGRKVAHYFKRIS
jgi:hypothetical protein